MKGGITGTSPFLSKLFTSFRAVVINSIKAPHTKLFTLTLLNPER